jgi:hypothetical protein
MQRAGKVFAPQVDTWGVMCVCACWFSLRIRSIFFLIFPLPFRPFVLKLILTVCDSKIHRSSFDPARRSPGETSRPKQVSETEGIAATDTAKVERVFAFYLLVCQSPLFYLICPIGAYIKGNRREQPAAAGRVTRKDWFHVTSKI